MTTGRLDERELGEPGDLMERGFDFLRRFDAATCAEGKHDIGAGVYAMVERYGSRSPDEKKFEAHRRYSDIQFVAEGRERIDLAATDRLSPVGMFDDEKDVGFYEDPADFQSLSLEGGCYAIFYPRNAHKPGLFHDAGSEPVVKVVVKVPVSSITI